jgi:hypothetical protein
MAFEPRSKSPYAGRRGLPPPREAFCGYAGGLYTFTFQAKLDPPYLGSPSGEGKGPEKTFWNSPLERIEDSGGGLYKRFFRPFPSPGGLHKILRVKFSRSAARYVD